MALRRWIWFIPTVATVVCLCLWMVMTARPLLMKLGVTAQELDQHRPQFEWDAEVTIPLVADETVVEGEGFNPRKA